MTDPGPILPPKSVDDVELRLLRKFQEAHKQTPDSSPERYEQRVYLDRLWCTRCLQQLGPAGQCGCHIIDERAVAPDTYTAVDPKLGPPPAAAWFHLEERTYIVAKCNYCNHQVSGPIPDTPKARAAIMTQTQPRECKNCLHEASKR